MQDQPAFTTADRQRWMAVLARADLDTLRRLCPALPAQTRLRGPEIGMTMLRGRAGGTGSRFNLGEMTVTRCTIRNSAGLVGHAYIAGRNDGLAELAAVLDAALQDHTLRPTLEATIIAPLEAAQAATRAEKSRRAAATRVDFFTMATMRS